MSGQFRVDLTYLEQLLQRLNGSTAAASSAFSALHEVGPIRTGHKSLDTACDSFQKDCAREMKELREQINVLAVGLVGAKERYGATEQALNAVYRSGAVPSPITQALG